MQRLSRRPRTFGGSTNSASDERPSYGPDGLALTYDWYHDHLEGGVRRVAVTLR